VGQYEISADANTPIGHSFVLSEPVAISDYREEKTRPYPDILQDHGCVSSINVPLRTDTGTFGVLEVDDTQARSFSPDDFHFLTGLGNTIGRAIELRRALNATEKALEQKQLLVREMNHRIKNNLSLVSAILRLQAQSSQENAVQEELSVAVARINNMALVHDRLQFSSSSTAKIAAASHFQELCEMLRSLLPEGISLQTRCSGSLAGDSIESLTLIANELITNAAKHAFKGAQGGVITLGYREEGPAWRLWVEDNGSGRPGPASGDSFGTQLIETLAARLNAEVRYLHNGGTRIEVACGLSGTGEP
jgi:two-component sensor histidine kinase